MIRQKRLPELDGYRAILIFIVSWYHIWQQSWWTPGVGSVSLDFLVRSGYDMVDGTMILSAFLLFLPWVRSSLDGKPLPDRAAFYKKRAARILPSYYFIILLVLFAVVLPWGLYRTPQFAVKDLFTHFTMTFTFWADTYNSTPLGAAFWTLAIEVQFYLLFPLLARACLKKPVLTLCGMTLSGWAFRGWCIWALSDYSMVLNQFPSFLDTFALGMLGALLFARLERLESEGWKPLLCRVIATLAVVDGIVLLVMLLKAQASESTYTAIQKGQMIRRFPLCCIFLLIIMGLPLSLRPVRLLFGNPVMTFLSGISMNYYMIHQILAVHLKRLKIPASVSETPNQVGEMPWQWQYTFLAFGISLLLSIIVTYCVEKPAARYLQKRLKL